MSYDPDYDTETDFIKRVEKDFNKTQRLAEAMEKINTVTDAISSLCILVILVISVHKGIYFLSEKMNQAYDSGEMSWYLIYTSSLILIISIVFKTFLKAIQGKDDK